MAIIDSYTFRTVAARRQRIGRLLIATGVAIVLMASAASNAIAGAGLDQTVVVVNSSATLSGSVETFRKGSNLNRRPKFNDILRGGKPNLGIPVLQRGTGVAVSPTTGLNFVASGGTNAVLAFSPTLNGVNLPPDQMITFSFISNCLFLSQAAFPNLGLCLPNGVAFDSMASPIVDTPGEQVYVASLAPPLFDTSFNICGGGSVEVFDSFGNGNDFPNRLIFGCNAALTYGLSLADPVGLFVDEATVDLCIGSDDDATDLCDPARGNFVVPIPTRRIWVLSRRMSFKDWVDLGAGGLPPFPGGNVGIYEPEIADTIDALGLAPSVSGVSSFCNLPYCNEPAIGGLFFTTTDGLAPNGSSSDTTNPNYLAVDATETTAYVTDVAGGFKKRGRVKAIALQSAPFCLAPYGSAGSCTLAVKEFVGRASTTTIEGPHTMLNQPMGIAVATVAAGDELFVTNVNTNSLIEFGPGASGDVAPIVSVSGRQTGMNQPAGIALTPPPLIP
jgi:hypothetical protein